MGERRDDNEEELLLAAAKQHGERIEELERRIRNLAEELSLVRQRYRVLKDEVEALSKKGPR